MTTAGFRAGTCPADIALEAERNNGKLENFEPLPGEESPAAAQRKRKQPNQNIQSKWFTLYHQHQHHRELLRPKAPEGQATRALGAPVEVPVVAEVAAQTPPGAHTHTISEL